MLQSSTHPFYKHHDIFITIMILRQILYLAYLCPCLALVLFMWYLCDLFFIFCLIFIIINCIISLKLTYLLFAQYHILVLEITQIKKMNNFQIAKGQLQSVTFAWFFANFSLSLLIKVLLLKKACKCWSLTCYWFRAIEH